MTFFRGILILMIAVGLFACHNQRDAAPTKLSKEQRIDKVIEDDFMRTYDPALGYPPKERLYDALVQTRQMQLEYANRRSADDLRPKFDERGPSDIGGRTRAILIDLNDPEGKKIWAGSVSGGLFVTDDITAVQPEWRKADDYLDNLSVSSLVQDPNNPDIMYMGTGEGVGNGLMRGLGIFKSSDGGETWTLLESTRNSTFAYVQGMTVQPETGYVYAATRTNGVYRTEDGGELWKRVLGTGAGAQDNGMFDVIAAGGRMFASSSTDVYMSNTGDQFDWEHITQSGSGFPTNFGRTEIAPCANGDVIFACGAIGSAGSPIYKTTDGGQNWVNLGLPGGTNYAGGQAWYDLDIAADPFNCNKVIVGGIEYWISNSGGSSWSRLPHSSYATSIGHVDQHKIQFDELRQGVVYFGNDGGVWRSTDGNAQLIDDKNYGYITTQYYGCAIHPDTFSNYMLGGTQDNGSHALDAAGVSAARRVGGGDGVLCHIDQNDPRYQIISSQNAVYRLSENGGASFSGGENLNGRFINPSDYDSDDKILYAETNEAGGDFYRWNVETKALDLVNYVGALGEISAVYADPNVPHRLYLGTFSGQVVRIDSAHVGDELTGEVLYETFNRTVSSIAVANGSPDDIIVTISNYGAFNVLVSNDSGESWSVCDGNLPDMPVRTAIFNPKDPSEALIGTEAGVWSTNFLNGSATEWFPPLPGEGTPVVRTDHLDWRKSDLTVIAGTHGRGLWTSNVFSEPRAKFVAPQVHYEDSPLKFIGSVSLNAQSYAWDFGDGSTSTEENPVHSYEQIGEYTVSLTINGDLSTSAPIKILPRAPMPYVAGETGYGGSFENHPEQVGTEWFGGSRFEIGNSEFIGKTGARTGEYAMVTDPSEPFYEMNTSAAFYLPRFDFSDTSIYQFSFFAAHFLQGNDGFIVEYSTDAGQSWQILGKQSNTWYNFNSNSIDFSAWPSNTPYFTKEIPGYRKYRTDVTFLSGEPDVAFRFRFRSDGSGLHPGVAIDDVEISKYEGELRTNVTEFDGEFTDANKEITLRWSTLPEYHCQRFEVERSFNGRDFEKIGEEAARGVVSANVIMYEFEDSQGGEIFFYRVKVINEDVETGYYYEFYTPTITVRRSTVDGGEVYESGSGPRIFPNPFAQEINVTFTSNLQQNVLFELYDAAGRLVLDREVFVDDVFTSLEVSDMPSGVYYLGIQIGDGEREVYPLVKG